MGEDDGITMENSGHAIEKIGYERAYNLLTEIVAALMTDLAPNTDVILRPDWRERLRASGKIAATFDEPDGGIRVRLTETPRSADGQAVWEAGPPHRWLNTTNAKEVRVVACYENWVRFTEKLEGSYDFEKETVAWHADCFLRDHVLAGTVPILGGSS